MADKPLRLILAVSLLWTGMNICLMPQAECERQARPPCHCHHGSQHRCCTGVHLTEACVQSGVAFVAPPPLPFALAQTTPSPDPGTGWKSPLSFIVLTAPRHPPPRESTGRSPPSA